MNRFLKRFVFSIRPVVAIAAVLAALSGGPAFAASGRLVLESGGVKRSAFLVEHARLKRAPRATVIVLHGQSGNGLRVRRFLGLEDIMKSQSVVAVYPDAIDGHWDLREGAGNRDQRFILDLVRKLEADGVTDRRKVFIVGSATGGILAMRLACADAQSFAGAASLITLMPVADAAVCKPARAIPFFLMVGTADPMIPYAGGKAGLVEYKGDVVSADATLAPFLQAAGCSGKRVRKELEDKDPNDGSRVSIETFQDCKAPVELAKIEGGGHTLPGRKRIAERGLAVGAHNNDVDAARMVLDFLRRASGG